MSGMGRGAGRGAGINKPAWMVQKEREEAAAGPGGAPPSNGAGGDGAGGANGGDGRYADADERGGRRSRSRSRDRDSGGGGSRSRERGPEPDQFGRTNRGGGGGGRDYDDRRGGRDYDDRRGGRDYDRRGGGRDDYDRRDRRGGGGGRDARRRRPPAGMHFRSYEEERHWLADRARKRRARRPPFDVEPTPDQLADEQARAALEVAHNTLGRAATGATGANVGLNAGRYGSGGGGGSLQPQQTRHARRLYVGNVPDVTEDDVHDFFRDAIKDSIVLDPDQNPSHASHKNQYVDSDPILSVYINRERRFAFLEFKTMEITTACLALDGIDVLGRGKVKVKRPNDYNAALAPASNPATAPRLDTAALGIISPTVPDGPNKIFIGGLPYHLTEPQVLELLQAFGTVRAFHLVKQDAASPTSKGYCFVEYSDPNVTQVACMGLNGMDMGGGKQLSCRMAAQHLAQQRQAAQGAMEAGGGAFGAPVAAPPVQASVVDGVDVDALLQQALGGGGGAPMAAAPMGAMGGMMPQPMAGMGMLPQQQQQMGMAPMGMGMMPQQPLAGMVVADPLAVANAAASALDMAFGGTAAPLAAPVAAPAMQQPQQPQAMPPAAGAGPTRVLVLLNMVMDEDLATAEDHKMLEEEVREEVGKYGQLVSMKIPRPQDGYAASAVKKIFLEYATVNDALSAEKELKGRAFGPNVVDTKYFSEDEYARGNLN